MKNLLLLIPLAVLLMAQTPRPSPVNVGTGVAGGGGTGATTVCTALTGQSGAITVNLATAGAGMTACGEIDIAATGAVTSITLSNPSSIVVRVKLTEDMSGRFTSTTWPGTTSGSTCGPDPGGASPNYLIQDFTWDGVVLTGSLCTGTNPQGITYVGTLAGAPGSCNAGQVAVMTDQVAASQIQPCVGGVFVVQGSGSSATYESYPASDQSQTISPYFVLGTGATIGSVSSSYSSGIQLAAAMTNQFTDLLRVANGKTSIALQIAFGMSGNSTGTGSFVIGVEESCIASGSSLGSGTPTFGSLVGNTGTLTIGTFRNLVVGTVSYTTACTAGMHYLRFLRNQSTFTGDTATELPIILWVRIIGS